MPPEMAISMRHNKLKAEEAAILAGELNKPSWESRNEGIHERVSFEDTIWGFDLAGGSYYKTPLRVTYVKTGSRADKAGIRPGDKLKRINDIDTSTLTIQEAHDIIVSSGVHLKIAVTAPEDEEDSYHCYQDELQQDSFDEDAERRRLEELARKRQVHARVSHYWSLQWPWVSKRRVIYRESNCFLVPSKFEDKNKERFPPRPILRLDDDVVISPVDKDHIFKNYDKQTMDLEQELKRKNNVNKSKENSVERNLPEPLMNGNTEAPLKDILTNGATEIINTKDHELMQRFLNEAPKIEEEPKVNEEIVDSIVTDEKSEEPVVNESMEEMVVNDIAVESNVSNMEVVEENGTQNINDNVDASSPEPTEESQPDGILTNGEINGEVQGPDLVEEVEPEAAHTEDEVIDEILNEEETAAVTEQQQDDILNEVASEAAGSREEIDETNITDER